MIKVLALMSLLGFLQCVSTFDSQNVVFVIVSQPEPYHAGVATNLKEDLENQVLEVEKQLPRVHLTHEDFPILGAWTIVPLLDKISIKYGGDDVRWVVFVEPHTAVRCPVLFDLLSSANDNPEIMWTGYPLSDEEPTIIHHFAFYEELDGEHGGLIYPNFASGFAMKMELIAKLVNQIENGKRKLDMEFSIDPAFELAQLIYGSKEDPGPLLTPDLRFCVVASDNCATYPTPYDVCGSAIPEDSIFFAVKTWSGYHATRAAVVKKTWGKHVSNLLFFSDKADPTLPSIDVGIPNSKTGHCAKTMAILRHSVELVKDMPKVKWIFLADDDTILGVQRLCEVLSCLRGGNYSTILGERYGYGYGKKETATKGYDFVTGGAGAALSVRAAGAARGCACGAAPAAAPDDMALGACAALRLRLPLTHSPLFHQNRPQDYSRSYLARGRPVSFHRHSSPEPLRVYATWFHQDHLAARAHHDDL